MEIDEQYANLAERIKRLEYENSEKMAIFILCALGINYSDLDESLVDVLYNITEDGINYAQGDIERKIFDYEESMEELDIFRDDCEYEVKNKLPRYLHSYFDFDEYVYDSYNSLYDCYADVINVDVCGTDYYICTP